MIHSGESIVFKATVNGATFTINQVGGITFGAIPVVDQPVFHREGLVEGHITSVPYPMTFRQGEKIAITAGNANVNYNANNMVIA